MTTRLATVIPVAESAATGKVAEIFADIKRTKNIDFVPNLWRVLATSPLDARTREIIALAVSATNGCRYCVNSHTATLKRQGVDDVALGEILGIVALFNSTNVLADGYQVEPDILP